MDEDAYASVGRVCVCPLKRDIVYVSGVCVDLVRFRFYLYFGSGSGSGSHTCQLN